MSTIRSCFSGNILVSVKGCLGERVSTYGLVGLQVYFVNRKVKVMIYKMSMEFSRYLLGDLISLFSKFPVLFDR
jgi:hypothetical protein